MTSLSQDLGDATIDIFEGNSIDVTNSSRQSNAARVSLEAAGVAVSAQFVQDGANGEDKVDSYELGASAEVAGVTVAGTYTDEKVSSTKTYLAGAGINVAGVTIGGAFERVDVAGVETDTLSAVAAVDVAGNTLKGGYQKADGDDAVYLAEVQHNFSKNTNAYVNYKMDQDDSVEDTLGVGLRMSF
jgi:predicted porin